MGRRPLNLTAEERKARRSDQKRVSRATTRERDPIRAKRKAADQRWLYRQRHPNKVAADNQKKVHKRYEENLANIAPVREKQVKEIRMLVRKKLCR